MLEAIAALSLATRNYPDLAVVGALLLVNAALATLQQHRAAGAAATLKRSLGATARVKRDAAWKGLPARELVPGDIVRLRPGDIIPADLQLLEGALALDPSALTGESQGQDAGPGGMLLAGALLRRGEGKGVVLRTGAATRMGRTLQLVAAAQPKLHLDQVMAKVVRWLFLVIGAMLALVLALTFVRGTPWLSAAPLLLILLVSAVPMALPVMFTVSMAVGARELARSGVLVTRLSAVEDAATMDRLCVDKTGTLTMNQLAIAAVAPWGGADEDAVLRAAALASKESDQDPLDRAFLGLARERRLFEPGGPATVVSFQAFEPATRLTAAVVLQGGLRSRCLKGAVDAIALACRLGPADGQALQAQATAMAAQGFRVLAVAAGPEAQAPTLLGLVQLHDPLRPDAAALVAALRGLGVGVKLLTGDSLAAALPVGRALGLGNIGRMADFKGGSASLDSLDGLAEVYPEDKFVVVQRLQADGHSTGMTGDGINDAPALRQAEVGIAVSNATDAAKASASVVLTLPGLGAIVPLVQQGRAIYQRLLTYIVNKVSRTILKAAFISLAFIVTGQFVLSAFALLLLLFITDFAKVSLSTDLVRPSEAPETWQLGPWIALAAAQGGLMVVETLAALAYAWKRSGLASDPAALNSFSFLLLLYFAAFSIVSARERRRFWASRPSAMVAASVLTELVVGTLATRAGLPGLKALPWPLMRALLAYALLACLGLNDAIKAALPAGRAGRAPHGKPAPAALRRQA
jgi:plasma-membrane proton-efflux P-type ATPase